MGIMTTLKNGKDKVLTFYKAHKTGVKIAAGVVTTAVIGGVLYIIHRNSTGEEEFVELSNAPELPALNEATNDDTVYDTDDMSALWKEDYRENWNKVNEFAKTLELEDGESYFIERNSEFDDVRLEKGLPTNIVSHMIDYEGCYPPDDEPGGRWVELQETT